MSGPGANIILSWVSEVTDLDEQIEALQAAKRDFYSAVRDEHGKPVASGLKAAMRIHRMDSEKRADAEKVDEETFRILSIIEGQSLAPRATRVASDVPDHDPDTGEITESGDGSEQSTAVAPSEPEDGAVAGPDENSESPTSPGAGQATYAAAVESPATEKDSAEASPEARDAGEAQDRCESASPPTFTRDPGPLPDFLRRTG